MLALLTLNYCCGGLLLVAFGEFKGPYLLAFSSLCIFLFQDEEDDEDDNAANFNQSPPSSSSSSEDEREDRSKEGKDTNETQDNEEDCISGEESGPVLRRSTRIRKSH